MAPNISCTTSLINLCEHLLVAFRSEYLILDFGYVLRPHQSVEFDEIYKYSKTFKACVLIMGY